MPLDGNEDFLKWYRGHAKKAGIDPDPDNPAHKYDYRAAYAAGDEPTISKEDGKYHWPSRHKADDHPNRYVDGVDTKTGKKSRYKTYQDKLNEQPGE